MVVVDKIATCIFKNSVLLGLENDGRVSIKKCCAKRFHPNTLGSYTIDEFRGLDLSSLFKSLKGKTDGFENIGPDFSDSCGNTTFCSFPNSEIDSVQVNFLQGCNAHCSFCCEAYQRDKLRLYLPECKSLYFETLYKLKSTGIKSLRLTDAGEPFLFLKEMKDFLRSLHAEDFNEIYIVSNGHNIDDELVSLINNSPIPIFIGVSVNAADRETRKKIMGLDDFDEVVNSILKMPRCQVSFCICEENKHQLEDFIKFWESKGKRVSILNSIH